MRPLHRCLITAPWMLALAACGGGTGGGIGEPQTSAPPVATPMPTPAPLPTPPAAPSPPPVEPPPVAVTPQSPCEQAYAQLRAAPAAPLTTAGVVESLHDNPPRPC